MAGDAGFARESTPGCDIAVLSIHIESRCGQSGCESRRSPCLSHGHTPWPLILKRDAILDGVYRRHHQNCQQPLSQQQRPGWGEPIRKPELDLLEKEEVKTKRPKM